MSGTVEVRIESFSATATDGDVSVRCLIEFIGPPSSDGEGERWDMHLRLPDGRVASRKDRFADFGAARDEAHKVAVKTLAAYLRTIEPNHNLDAVLEDFRTLGVEP